MAYTDVDIDPGATPSVPVAVDAISSVNYQINKLADGTEGSTSAIGVDANPFKVKNRRRGTADYDSGRVAVATPDPAEVTASTIYPESGIVTNTTTSARVLTLTNAADDTLLILTLAPKSTVQLPVPASGAWVGLKAGADGAGVVLQIAGAQ
jgi:hypothetical protein